MPEIICIASQKGGVGKTTTSIHLAAGLAHHKYKTLLIDLDPQRNASSIFHDFLEADNFGTYSVFRDELDLQKEHFQDTRFNYLKILPANVELSEAVSMNSHKKNNIFLLRNALQKFTDFFEYIIIDCPPSLSFLTLNAFVAASGILIPIQPSRFVIDGILDLLKIYKNIQQRYNTDLVIVGALLNNFNSRTAISKAALPLIQKHIPVLTNQITSSIVIEEAHLMRQTVYEYNKRHKLSSTYKKLVKEIIQIMADGISY